MNEVNNIINVNMGEIKTTRRPAVFSCTGIGSCVVLFIYEPKTSIGGVAHIMLPESASLTSHDKKYFADTSPSLLIEELLFQGAESSRLKAKLVGGANVFSWAASNQMAGLGKTNLEKVKEVLLKNRIYIAAEEVGGNGYKTARCNTLTGSVTVKMDKDFEKVI